MGRKRKAELAPTNAHVAYYRVSTSKQEVSGLGLAAQEQAVERYVSSRNGTILGSFTEVESGKISNRPQLTEALALCKKHRATLTVAKLDRLSRSLAFIATLMESGVEFAVADMPSASKLTLHVLAVVAQNEREMISARTRAGLAVVQQELRERGFRISKAGRKFTKLGNPKWRAALVKARAGRKFRQSPERIMAIIMAMRAEGKSFQAVADHLNALGIRTVGGSIWYGTSVRNELNKTSVS